MMLNADMMLVGTYQYVGNLLYETGNSTVNFQLSYVSSTLLS